MDTYSKASLEAMLCIYNDAGELIAVAKKNGETIFYTTRKASFGDMAELLGADVPDKIPK